ncbi:MAG: hypothetical protein HYR49_06820 [Gammaproteobacteria bacterium]|nr:hypothetical protein [Gammaproteobacteria bacterium]
MQLTLFIPGLTGPKARYSAEFIPSVPALDLLLGRGLSAAAPEESFSATLARLFGCAPEPGRDVPVGAVTHHLDAAGVGRGVWMRADPVHLRADRRSVILLEVTAAQLDTRDALALAAEVKPLIESAGFALEVPCPERWYLRLPEQPDVRTTELDQVAGRDIAGALPEGPGAATWRRLLNEIQMTLHQSAVNAGREARGLPAINSLWFWGCGATPAPDSSRWTRIHGDELFLRGLAELAGSVCLPVPQALDGCLDSAGPDDRILVVDECCRQAAAYQDVEGWVQAVTALEQNWFMPLKRALQAGAVHVATVITDRLQLEIRRHDLMCFWRRRSTLARLAPGVAES